MTVYLNTNTDRYWGNSTDTKPTPVNIGSFFNEQDTGKIYVCYNGIDWVPYPSRLANRSILNIKTF